ncbi:hypothetical protein [Thalassolituus marinus]|uniref:Uncharacterized protein n=1 Tax=Thalassolituus marinus TaxID=671053 RepID=A0ABS7ZQJ8_9GAMM|nr:hypothetical protein [Thalassolituus marinus]MCA6062761.1 hypothetical protein [Thalassolituus marinus]
MTKTSDSKADSSKAQDADKNHERPARYEVVAQRGGARIRVRYREGSRTDDCQLCK